MLTIIVGSKGGVGTTTLCAALSEVANVETQRVDLSGTGDLAYVADQRPVLLDDIARFPDHTLGRARGSRGQPA